MRSWYRLSMIDATEFNCLLSFGGNIQAASIDLSNKLLFQEKLLEIIVNLSIECLASTTQ